MSHKCEYEGCMRLATTEWVAVDEDGDSYYTVRCNHHPVESTHLEFVPRPL